MKVLVLCEYPPQPAGLATQGELLTRGLREIGVDVHAVHLESDQEKEWYYRWFAPDVAVGIGYWGYTPHLILHPQRHGVTPVPWLVADGYIAKHRDVLNALPLILLTSRWVREVYIRDGITPDNLEVMPVGCDTDAFVPHPMTDPRVASIREGLGVKPDELMLLTVGGDAASKGAQEIMHALATIKDKIPPWRYVCKVWPQPRTDAQNMADMLLAQDLEIADRVIYATQKVSRNFMPFLLNACDIYVAPSRLEGFGMPQVEAGACCKPVISIRAMGLLDTHIHGETALLARVAQENWVSEGVITEDGGRIVQQVTFERPRVADYRASVKDLAEYLLMLMTDPDLRRRMGEAARRRAVECLDYRVVARQFVDIVSRRLPTLREAPAAPPMSQTRTGLEVSTG